MKHYVGIDLGTTNSSICSYDGADLRLYKSPEQNDVTPSAIFIDRRGTRYVGLRAYNNAAGNPDSSATLFKRHMGTSTPIKLSAVNVTMTPEQCSAEILRVLFGYLPEEVRKDQDTGTVITVPAAFNQMQKDATMTAALSAGLGRTALMQEPVAAVMSVMQHRKGDGVFLVYDLGGGTLDIAIAESISRRVSLLAHGGIAMCGGRDFDRILCDSVVKPWLVEHFDLPRDFTADSNFRSLVRMAIWATERAKIELSSKDETVISLPENELGVKDRAGSEIYLDVPLKRSDLDDLVRPLIDDSIRAARDTMEKAGLRAADVERIVFVGGPTHYKPLRDRVAFELGIAPSTDVNPMTAVAEGAAVFAESIDWSSEDRHRKSGRGALAGPESSVLTFNFIARTPEARARIEAQVRGAGIEGSEFQVDSLETGWSSGRIALRDGAVVDVPLSKPGDNLFKIFVFDAHGGGIRLNEDRLTIARTAAQIDAIPASHSIGVEARDKVGGRIVLDYLVREGEQLPKTGTKVFFAEESLRAGGAGSIRFKLWEGNIEDPIEHNLFIGVFEIKGSDFEDGVIAKGEKLVLQYEILDSGNIVLNVEVPSIRGSFSSGRNLYSRQEGQIDYTQASKRVLEESARTLNRLEEMSSQVDDERLREAKSRLEAASSIRPAESDPESAKRAMDQIQDAKTLMAKARKDHLSEIRQLDLEAAVKFFDDLRKYAKPAEANAFDNLVKTARRAIDNGDPSFESYMSELRGKTFSVLWRQEWFVIDRFKWLASAPHRFPDANEHAEVVTEGLRMLEANDIDALRKVVARLDTIRIDSASSDDMLSGANIVRS